MKSPAMRSNRKIKAKQWVYAGVAMAALVVTALVGAYITSDSKEKQQVLAVDKPTTRSIGGGVTDADKDSFRVQMSGQVSDVTRQLNDLASTNNQLREQNETIRREGKQREDFFKAELDRLSKPQLNQAVPPPVAAPVAGNPFTGQGQAPQPPIPRGAGALGVGPDGRPLDGGGSRMVREKLDSSDASGVPANSAPGANTTTDLATGRTTKVVDTQGTVALDGSGGSGTFLPTGTYVRAVLLNGLDAPTGGNTSQTPHPVLLRIVDVARLPNGVKNNLRDCVITANGYGDVASERAFIRTDRISCVDADGKAIDTRLQGYISGEDGKTGMRGRMVQKSGAILTNALLAGIGSGIGNAFRSGGIQTTQSPLTGATTETTTDAFKSGVGTGVSKAFDQLASYYIRLAEKVFPIIEIDAGRVVDVVLQQGMTLERSAN